MDGDARLGPVGQHGLGALTAAPFANTADLALERGESSAAVDRLLEDSWTERLSPIPCRQRLAGGAMTLAFVIAACALVVVAPAASAQASLALIVGLAVSYAVSTRVEFPVGAGYAVPTQLFLIPLFVLAPAATVPLIVFGALSVAALIDVARQRILADRLVDVGVDAWHAVAPALVFVAAGTTDPTQAPVWLFPAALLAQMLSEVAVTSLRLWLGQGIAPQLQLRVLATVWTIDIVLTPIAVVAAVAASTPGFVWAPLAPLGMVLLLAMLSRDRTARIELSHERLEALRTERLRLDLVVQRMGDAFASKLDLDALLDVTMRGAAEALEAEAACASVYAGPGRQLERRATLDDDEELRRALLVCEQDAARRGEISVLGAGSVVAVACPVREPSSGLTVGIVALAKRGSGFSDRQQELLAYLCERAGVAVGDIERHTVLRKQANSDELTGLANVRRFLEVLETGADAFHLRGASLSLVLVHLDDFRTINESRGHQAGDLVLREVAEVLRRCSERGDEAARYTGEELALVLNADLPTALVVAERVRAAIEETQLVDSTGVPLRVTASIGVAALDAEIRGPHELIAAADRALFQAKYDGRNCVRTLARSAA
jgi:diguanylate cyclase (GGDEF)-like protein